MSAPGPPQSSLDLQAIARALLDHVADGIAAFDRDGRVLFVNQSARQALGLPGNGDPDAGALRQRAVALGGRAEPLELGGRRVGDVIVLPGTGGGTLAERERRAIVEALESTHGRLTETARRLGISRTTLWRRLKAYGLDRHREAGQRR